MNIIYLIILIYIMIGIGYAGFEFKAINNEEMVYGVVFIIIISWPFIMMFNLGMKIREKI